MSENPWGNRIVGFCEADPADLKRNASNWRTHPEAQAHGLRAVLDRVGLVQGVIVNRTTGNLVDGHLRVDAALAVGQKTIPVIEVELTDDEERLVLATFDPLGEMALADEEALRSLLGSVEVPESFSEIVSALMERHGFGEGEASEVEEASDDDLRGPAVAERGGGSTVRTFTFQVDAKQGAIVDRCFGKLGEKYPKMEDGLLFVQALMLAEQSC